MLCPRLLLFSALLMGVCSARAQDAPGPAPDAAGHQKTERIRTEDSGSRVDELRIGGQTRSIHVQPKMEGIPAYQVQSVDGARSQRARSGQDGTNGVRLWTIGTF